MSEEVRPAQKRVLFVADDDTLRLSFAQTIAQLGYAVDTAASPGDAVAQMQARNYPIVVGELRAPGRDRIGLLEQLCVIRPATVFVLVAADPGLELLWSEHIDSAIASVVHKPADLEELRQSLSHAVEFQQRRVNSLAEKPRTAELTLLLVEDNPAYAESISGMLDGLPVVVETTLARAVQRTHNERFAAIMTPLALSDARGLEAVIRLQTSAPEAALIVTADRYDEVVSRQVIRLGAQDYLVKEGLTQQMLLHVLGCAVERRRTVQRLVQLAHHDQLTGLMNRNAFCDHLTRAVVRARRHHKRIAVLVLDIDGFKAVNDTFGHDAGDALLQELGHRMRQVFREYDLIARVGGDEFAVALTEVEGLDSVATIAQRALDSLALPAELDGHRVSVSASIGIAFFPDSAQSIAELLKRADLAMYEAKGAGKNTFCNSIASEPPPRLSSWPAPPVSVRELLRSEITAIRGPHKRSADG